MTSKHKWLVLLYGDIDFDGRARRMIDIARGFGEVHLLDCAEKPPAAHTLDYSHERVLVAPELSPPRRHLKFLGQALRMARQLRPDVVLAEDFFTAMPGRLVAGISRARYIYDAHELIIPGADERVSGRQWFWAALERRAAPAADLVIAANSERAQIMTESYPLRHPVSYMRNIPAAPSPTQAHLTKVQAKYPALTRHAPNEVLVLYQGAITAERGLQRFIEAVVHLPPEYRLVVAGDGPDLGALRALGSEDRFGGRIDFLGRVPNAEVAAVAQLCDIGIVTYDYDTRNSLLCAPNKVFEYAQAGISVVASDQLPLRNLLDGRPWARTLAPEAGPIETAARILELPRDRAATTADIAGFLAQNTSEAECARIEALFAELLGEGQE